MHRYLIETVRKYIPLLCEVEAVYLFGSVLDVDKTPNDIDILIIYLEYKNVMHQYVKEFAAKVESTSGLKVDLTMLSVEEEKEVRFLERINSLQLK